MRPDRPRSGRDGGGGTRGRTVAVFAGLFLLSFIAGLVLSGTIGSRVWPTGPAHPGHPAGSSATPSGPAPVLNQHLVAARRALAVGDLRRARNEYLTILLSIDADSAEAWQGLMAVRRRSAGDDPLELRRDAHAYRLAITHAGETDDHYTPQALELLAEASRRAAAQIDAEHRNAAAESTQTSAAPDQASPHGGPAPPSTKPVPPTPAIPGLPLQRRSAHAGTAFEGHAPPQPSTPATASAPGTGCNAAGTPCGARRLNANSEPPGPSAAAPEGAGHPSQHSGGGSPQAPGSGQFGSPPGVRGTTGSAITPPVPPAAAPPAQPLGRLSTPPSAVGTGAAPRVNVAPQPHGCNGTRGCPGQLREANTAGSGAKNSGGKNNPRDTVVRIKIVPRNSGSGSGAGPSTSTPKDDPGGKVGGSGGDSGNSSSGNSNGSGGSPGTAAGPGGGASGSSGSAGGSGSNGSAGSSNSSGGTGSAGGGGSKGGGTGAAGSGNGSAGSSGGSSSGSGGNNNNSGSSASGGGSNHGNGGHAGGGGSAGGSGNGGNGGDGGAGRGNGDSH